MPVQIPDRLTVLTKPDLALGMKTAWGNLWGGPIPIHSLCIVLAQVQLETGLKSCHNFDLGNAKSIEGDGYDYQFFACGEELPLGVAQHAAATSPLVKITRQYYVGKVAMASVWVEPEHPWSRFRAFPNLADGCLDQLKLLHSRFTKAWVAVESGDPDLFVHYLKLQGYFTAPEAQYDHTLVQLYREWLILLPV